MVQGVLLHGHRVSSLPLAPSPSLGVAPSPGVAPGPGADDAAAADQASLGYEDEDMFWRWSAKLPQSGVLAAEALREASVRLCTRPELRCVNEDIIAGASCGRVLTVLKLTPQRKHQPTDQPRDPS